ncbi:hypothetical protein H2203_000318 [Taxawa tesnikishii (nom. ined.)]|nr:hypothetical protein H2203_000318 [Dothideales sp. JES 119]
MVSQIVAATIQAGVLSAISNTLAQLLSCYQEKRPYTIDPVPLAHFVLFSLLACPPNYLWQTWLERTFPGYTSPSAPGTTDSLSKHPAVQSVQETATPALRQFNEKASAATSALANNDIVQRVRRASTDGLDTVKAKAKQYEASLDNLKARRISVAEGSTFYADAQERMQTTLYDNEKSQPFYGDEKPEKIAERALPNKNTSKKLNVTNTAINVVYRWDRCFEGEPLDKIKADVKNDTWSLYQAGNKLWPAVSIISFTLIPVERRTVFGGIVGVGWGIFLSLTAAAKKTRTE